MNSTKIMFTSKESQETDLFQVSIMVQWYRHEQLDLLALYSVLWGYLGALSPLENFLKDSLDHRAHFYLEVNLPKETTWYKPRQYSDLTRIFKKNNIPMTEQRSFFVISGSLYNVLT